MWYEPKDKNFNTTERVSCPVCKTAFGRRDINIVYKAHCYECRASFTWYPGTIEPKAILDYDEEKRRCGCLSCEGKEKH